MRHRTIVVKRECTDRDDITYVKGNTSRQGIGDHQIFRGQIVFTGKRGGDGQLVVDLTAVLFVIQLTNLAASCIKIVFTIDQLFKLCFLGLFIGVAGIGGLITGDGFVYKQPRLFYAC